MNRGVDDEAIDAYLVSARRGEQQGFTALYERLAGRVAGYVRSRGAGDVDELVNDIFLAAFRNLPTFTGGASAFRSWLFGIAWNKTADWHRAAYRRPLTVHLDAAQAVATDHLDELPERLAAADLASLLGTLTDDQRDVLLLRIVADLSLAETAAVLGKPNGAIKSLQHRALAALARTLTNVPVSPTAPTTITSSRWNRTD